MPKRKKSRASANRSGVQQAKPATLTERLEQLSHQQLIKVVEEFVSQLGEKQRLQFLNLLPSVQLEELADQLSYEEDEDFLASVEDFYERVSDEEFVEYGAGFDPKEGEYHGFGDDSWIKEMDDLFDDAENYYLARRYETAMKAYQQLFDCLQLEANGGYYFTTSEPQSALDTDLSKARRNYFISLIHFYQGEMLAEKIIEGIAEYRYIGEKPPQVKELFLEYKEVIDLLEQTLIKRPSRDDANTNLTALDQPAELLRQIFKDFRSLAELDSFAQRHGKKHPWCYEELTRAYANNQNWQKVLYWADQGLNSQTSRKAERTAILADYKAKAAVHLGDTSAALSANWEAFVSVPDTARYLILRKAALAAGRWPEYYPQLVARLTHNISGNSVKASDIWESRLLVEALLVEGEYERAVEQTTQHRFIGYWDDKGNAPKSLINFFLHSITRHLDGADCAAQYQEISRRLNKPPDFIKQLKDELFQLQLSEFDRDRQIDWIVQIVKPGIDRIVKSRSQDSYAAAAHDAGLIVDLYNFQGRAEKADSFIKSLHAEYLRHRNFRAELKKLRLE